ncbi:MAG: hypothetical protein HQ567_20335 [Candidatus Nealsonbacteria bacterium]|nr:hypothetical protein [Candidatus Nealsonbacteria bacterium]
MRTLPATILCLTILLAILPSAGCQRDPHDIGSWQGTWGRRGISDGRLQKPRAIAIDGNDRLYLVDKTARIQAFDSEGNFLHGWRTPAHKTGKPTGLSIGRDGNVLVADTHYHRLLVYSPEGKELQRIGGGDLPSHEPGQFGQVTDAVQDSKGNYYVAEKGEYDRIQKFSADGRFLLQWGGHGTEQGQFVLPQSMVVDSQDRIWVTDSCNHRIQIFDVQGKWLESFGREGDGLGQLYYPYDLVLGDDRTVYILEYGNHRVQKFTHDARLQQFTSQGCWGSEGRGEGQLHNPWGLALDSRGKIHVLDTNNHRVQCVKM